MAEPVNAGRSVLLVEDDAAIAQMYKLRLEMEGYLVLTALDGETGLAMAKRFQPDLIVLDIGLPGMNGLSLLDVIRADDRMRAIPILILTNSDDSDNEKLSHDLGADGFMSKSKTTPDTLAGWLRRSI